MSVSQESGLFGKATFPYDLVACTRWCMRRGLSPICDLGIERIIVGSIHRWNSKLSDPGVMRICDIIPFLSNEEAARRVKKHSNHVWIFLGSAPCSPGFLREEAQAALREGAIMGIARASVFNGGYAGIHIHRWRHKEPGMRLARFYGGERM